MPQCFFLIKINGIHGNQKAHNHSFLQDIGQLGLQSPWPLFNWAPIQEILNQLSFYLYQETPNWRLKWRKVLQMQPMQLCIFLGRWYEDTQVKEIKQIYWSTKEKLKEEPYYNKSYWYKEINYLSQLWVFISILMVVNHVSLKENIFSESFLANRANIS